MSLSWVGNIDALERLKMKERAAYEQDFLSNYDNDLRIDTEIAAE
jgi:uncharacterized membrane protein